MAKPIRLNSWAVSSPVRFLPCNTWRIPGPSALRAPEMPPNSPPGSGPGRPDRPGPRPETGGVGHAEQAEQHGAVAFFGFLNIWGSADHL